MLEDTSTFFAIEFNKNDNFFALKIIKNKWSGKVNTEGYIVEELIINNKDMIYYENDKEKCICWQENNETYVLSGNIEKQMLIDIAEKIKITEETSPQN